MFLSVDVGNTTITWGVLNEGKVLFSFKTSSKPFNLSETELIIRKKFEEYSISFLSIEAAAVSSVISDNVDIHGFIDDLFGVKSLILNYDVLKKIVSFDISSPGKTGSDRIINAYEAVKKHKKTVVAVDAGTAVTWDVMTKDFIFKGGVIAPGIHTASQALALKTDKLFEVEFRHPGSMLGKNTEQCLQIGFIEGWASMIDGITSKIIREMQSEEITAVLTGGSSVLIKDKLEYPFIYAPYLTLEGISSVYFDVLSI